LKDVAGFAIEGTAIAASLVAGGVGMYKLFKALKPVGKVIAQSAISGIGGFLRRSSQKGLQVVSDVKKPLLDYNLQFFARDAANKIKPNSNADGAHSVFKTDPDTGKVTNYRTYEENPLNPSGFDEIKGYDGIGNPHTNKITGEDLMPHIHDKIVPGGVRTPKIWEIPR
jgi:hypothetical protein